MVLLCGKARIPCGHGVYLRQQIVQRLVFVCGPNRFHAIAFLLNQTHDNIAQMRPVSRFTLPLPNKKHRRSIMAAVGVLV